MQLPFFASQNAEENKKIFAITNMIIVKSAVESGLIADADLATVPEVFPKMVALPGLLRDDLYLHHQKLRKQLQMPIIQNCFCYAFAKGAEFAYLWNESAEGEFEYNYAKKDALAGRAGAQVSEEFVGHITCGMFLMADVFCDFQDKVLINTKLGFATEGRVFADVIASGFFSSICVGLDYGMNRLGFK